MSTDNPITDAREQLATALGLDSPYPPDRAAPPYLVITEAFPVLEQGQVFGTVIARFDIAYAVRDGSADVYLPALDQKLTEIVTALIGARWGFESVTYGTAADQNKLRGLTLTAFTEITL